LADANAAANNLVRRPLMTGEANTQLQGVANRFSQGVKPGETASSTAQGYADALRKSAAAGGESKAPTSSRSKYEAMGTDAGISRVVTDADKIAAGGIQGAGKVADRVGNFVADVMNVKEMNANLKTRDEGTLGKTGSAVEPADFIGKVAKGEMVLTPEQAKKFMEGAKTEGIAEAVKNLGGMMPGSAKGSDNGGFNLSSLSKEISTSVSSVTSGSSITQRTQTDDSKKAQEELNELKKQANAEKEAVREKIKSQLGPDATNREKHKAVRDSDELKGLEEKYNSLMEPLQKKIEAGIKWETETKSEQVEETKNFVKEQAEILKVSNNEMLAVQESTSTEKVDIEKEAKEKLAELAKTVNPALEKSTAPITKGIDAKAIASAMPAVPKFDKSKFAMPSMDQLTIGPDGMPKISAKPQAQTIPAAVKPAEKQASPGKKINPETGEEYTPVGDAKPADKKTATVETKTATLDDVAKLLSSLNTTMKQIATAASETNNKLGQQVKATKAMSGNVHGAV
jgi:chemotaxis protein histidine kinase CheA